jgi:hypothetical protein
MEETIIDGLRSYISFIASYYLRIIEISKKLGIFLWRMEEFIR